jgi:hypothetical protein
MSCFLYFTNDETYKSLGPVSQNLVTLFSIFAEIVLGNFLILSFA